VAPQFLVCCNIDATIDFCLLSLLECCYYKPKPKKTIPLWHVSIQGISALQFSGSAERNQPHTNAIRPYRKL
jgi:hypothetical protein